MPEQEQNEYREVLMNCSGTLINCLQPTKHLLQFLNDNEVLNNETMQKIQCRPNRGERVKTLLDFLCELGPKSASLFVESLRVTEQWFLANILATTLYKNTMQEESEQQPEITEPEVKQAPEEQPLQQEE